MMTGTIDPTNLFAGELLASLGNPLTDYITWTLFGGVTISWVFPHNFSLDRCISFLSSEGVSVLSRLKEYGTVLFWSERYYSIYSFPFFSVMEYPGEETLFWMEICSYIFYSRSVNSDASIFLWIYLFRSSTSFIIPFNLP